MFLLSLSLLLLFLLLLFPLNPFRQTGSTRPDSILNLRPVFVCGRVAVRNGASFSSHGFTRYFLQGLGCGLLYWAVSRSRNVYFTGQCLGNEMTVLVNLQAIGGLAKSKQCGIMKSQPQPQPFVVANNSDIGWVGARGPKAWLALPLGLGTTYPPRPPSMILVTIKALPSPTEARLALFRW